MGQLVAARLVAARLVAARLVAARLVAASLVAARGRESARASQDQSSSRVCCYVFARRFDLLYINICIYIYIYIDLVIAQRVQILQISHIGDAHASLDICGLLSINACTQSSEREEMRARCCILFLMATCLAKKEDLEATKT